MRCLCTRYSISSSHHCTSLTTPNRRPTWGWRYATTYGTWRGEVANLSTPPTSCGDEAGPNISFLIGRTKCVTPYWQDQIYYFLLARAWRCVVLCIYMRCRYQHVFRLNFSASDPDSQSDLYSDLRKVSHRVKFHVVRFVLKFHQVSRNHILIQIRVKCSGSGSDGRRPAANTRRKINVFWKAVTRPGRRSVARWHLEQKDTDSE